MKYILQIITAIHSAPLARLALIYAGVIVVVFVVGLIIAVFLDVIIYSPLRKAYNLVTSKPISKERDKSNLAISSETEGDRLYNLSRTAGTARKAKHYAIKAFEAYRDEGSKIYAARCLQLVAHFTVYKREAMEYLAGSIAYYTYLQTNKEDLSNELYTSYVTQAELHEKQRDYGNAVFYYNYAREELDPNTRQFDIKYCTRRANECTAIFEKAKARKQQTLFKILANILKLLYMLLAYVIAYGSTIYFMVRLIGAFIWWINE